MTDVIEMIEAHGINVTEIVAWTRRYNPFVMGGSCHTLMAAKLDCERPVHLGKGFYACLLKGPDGHTKVAEVLSGGIVGDTLEQVREDIADCEDVAVMKKQIEDAIAEKDKKGLSMMPADEWWSLAIASIKTEGDG